MYRFIIENENSEQLNLTDNPNYTIDRIDGLAPPTSTINRNKVAGYDGARYSSSRKDERNIVIYIDIECPAEENRLNLYKYIRPKRKIKMYYSNNTLDVFIEGYVESMPINHFAKKQQMQVSVICTDPDFNALEEMITNMSNIEALFEFPFDIDNEGEEFSRYARATDTNVINVGTTECGMEIILTARGQVVNPKIYNKYTTEFFGLNITMEAGDTIIINTNKGSKSVTLLRDSQEINIFNYIMAGSKFIDLEIGDNVFVYEASSGDVNLNVAFRHRDRFEGV